MLAKKYPWMKRAAGGKTIILFANYFLKYGKKLLIKTSAKRE
jgi:hypothetical protein